jgi:2-oxoglutarate dehydrogenase E1 component
VNGDDPEAVVRVAELAVAYRQEFNRDVVIDLVCYRRRGHNEGDDPSMTQPLMTNLIEAKRSVRRLYTEALVGRGDITEEEYDKAKADFQNRLEIAFAETHAAETGATASSPPPPPVDEPSASPRPPASVEVVHLIGDAFVNKPEGFTVHPKLQQLLDKRLDMSRNGTSTGASASCSPSARCSWRARTCASPARTRAAARSCSATPCCTTARTARNGCRWRTSPTTRAASTSTTRCSASTRRWLRVRLLGRAARHAHPVGGAVRRLRERRAVGHRRVHLGGRAEVGPAVERRAAAAARLRGPGPDHSSARIERYLQLCAQDNMTVARPSTPASYFHLLRRQAYARRAGR